MLRTLADELAFELVEELERELVLQRFEGCEFAFAIGRLIRSVLHGNVAEVRRGRLKSAVGLGGKRQ